MSIEPKSLSDAGLRNLIENYRRKGTSDGVYLEALAEYAKRKDKGLQFDKTMDVIRIAAADRRFLSYAELAAASGANWNQVHYSVGRHLGNLIEYCHRNGLPLLSAIVVNKPNVRTGEMEPDSLKGFIAGARALGITITDERAFLRTQQDEVFKWAQAKPMA